MSGMHPDIVWLDAGTHKVCRCGDSATMPMCDHSGRTRCEQAWSLVITQGRNVPICRCGRSGKMPVCDGRHGYAGR
ncbi:MAG: CDGSH iron-sulfur domain-containing protein [Magnetococcus sp. WYHC-3]